MLSITSLVLNNFKNYSNSSIKLCKQVNCFVGANGAGKTNILDAIYYLSFTKSYFVPIDVNHIKHGEEYFTVKANLLHNSINESIFISYQNGKKTLNVNNNEVKKLSTHIGTIPLVIISPNDIFLLYEGSDMRRKFLDGMIAQIDKQYLNALIQYNRTIEQRNKTLQQFAEQNRYDKILIDSYDTQLISNGEYIFNTRKQFLAEFTPLFQRLYIEISQTNETVSIEYQSDLHATDYSTLLNQQRQKDFINQRTTKGIHKDDLLFKFNNYDIKKTGSQGQQKSYIIALKLAQYFLLKQNMNKTPLLLLDDIFEKLDETRLKYLLQLITGNKFGQIFITDTHLERVKHTFESLHNIELKFFSVTNGTINEL